MESFFAGVQSRRDAWPPGRRDLHVHIHPPPRIAQQLVESYRTVTHDRPGPVPVPAEWMHIAVLIKRAGRRFLVKWVGGVAGTSGTWWSPGISFVGSRSSQHATLAWGFLTFEVP